ncbi:hypothetical protein Q9R19_08275 [Microbacterium sp. ARD32]|uniref:hypothetical protein n=1 Tax=Microbacterium sp. ARD32 TaxID=2962577 RepID=UPI00288265AE|nr:hypothetical protein [Microbacterium sp. ARD32]MDT0157615.1 hypothetical protein [Microbacterium sp. ARD32]
MKSPAPMALTAALGLGLLLAGCTGTATPAPTETGPAASDPAAPAPSSAAPASGTPAPGQGTDAVDELRDGTWQVGDAGDVEFSSAGGALALTDVRAAEGWQHRIADEKPGEIEVHFTRPDTEWKFEVELEGGTMQISKQLTLSNATGGSIRVGSAATLQFSAKDALAVTNVAPADGWTTVKRDEQADDIELSFQNSNGDGEAEFEAETGTGGVRVEISQKLSGPVG